MAETERAAPALPPHVDGLRRAADAGEVRDVDLEVAAYCLMGMGDFVGMRLVLWEGRRRVPPRVLRTIMEIVRHGLLNDARQTSQRPAT